MKQIVFLFGATLILTASALAQQTGSTGTHLSQTAGTASLPAQLGMSAQDWQELRDARVKAIKAHPELLAENTALMQKIRAFEAKLDAAMVKTNPAVAPILSKFEASRQPAGSTVSSPPIVSPPSTVK